jgi:hypothetical protein
MLYRKRRTIDILAVVYPVLIALLKRLLEWAQYKYFTKQQKKKSKMNIDMLDACMVNALEGLTDIQVNNLQPAQLANFDKIARMNELITSSSSPPLLSSFIITIITNH